MWASATSATTVGANFRANIEWSACAPTSPIDLKDIAMIVPSLRAPTLQW